jgi:hypothetical protein
MTEIVLCGPACVLGPSFFRGTLSTVDECAFRAHSAISWREQRRLAMLQPLLIATILVINLRGAQSEVVLPGQSLEQCLTLAHAISENFERNQLRGNAYCTLTPLSERTPDPIES